MLCNFDSTKIRLRSRQASNRQSRQQNKTKTHPHLWFISKANWKVCPVKLGLTLKSVDWLMQVQTKIYYWHSANLQKKILFGTWNSRIVLHNLKFLSRKKVCYHKPRSKKLALNATFRVVIFNFLNDYHPNTTDLIASINGNELK